MIIFEQCAERCTVIEGSFELKVVIPDDSDKDIVVLEASQGDKRFWLQIWPHEGIDEARAMYEQVLEFIKCGDKVIHV